MSAYLTEQQLAKIEAQLGDGTAATDDLLIEIAQQVKERREHDHKSAADWDWFCLNASGWLGDRMPRVLRRLLHAEAEVESLRARVTELESGDLTTYCAEFHGISMGSYRTREAARAHCEHDAAQDDLTRPLRWVSDACDYPAEDLFSANRNPDEQHTGYAVVPEVIPAAFDPEAGESL